MRCQDMQINRNKIVLQDSSCNLLREKPLQKLKTLDKIGSYHIYQIHYKSSFSKICASMKYYEVPTLSECCFCTCSKIRVGFTNTLCRHISGHLAKGKAGFRRQSAKTNWLAQKSHSNSQNEKRKPSTNLIYHKKGLHNKLRLKFHQVSTKEILLTMIPL